MFTLALENRTEGVNPTKPNPNEATYSARYLSRQNKIKHVRHYLLEGSASILYGQVLMNIHRLNGPIRKPSGTDGHVTNCLV